MPAQPENTNRLLQRLAKLLLADQLLTRPAQLAAYECDDLSVYQQRPLAVAIPDNEDQIRQLLKFCHEHKIPVVSRGAGTGLSGGTLPGENGIVLSIAKLNRILSIEPDNFSAVVQPGVRNLAVSEAVAELGLLYAPNPSSQITYGISGNVAENAGGARCLKYGLTGHNIFKLRVLTMTGEPLAFGSDALDAPGFDLLAVMTGSEELLAGQHAGSGQR